jgi:hypothetical protein
MLMSRETTNFQRVSRDGIGSCACAWFKLVTANHACQYCYQYESSIRSTSRTHRSVMPVCAGVGSLGLACFPAITNSDGRSCGGWGRQGGGRRCFNRVQGCRGHRMKGHYYSTCVIQITTTKNRYHGQKGAGPIP